MRDGLGKLIQKFLGSTSDVLPYNRFRKLRKLVSIECSDFIKFRNEVLKDEDFIDYVRENLNAFKDITTAGLLMPNFFLTSFKRSLDSSLIPYILIRFLKPEKIVETGVASGFSSMLMLKALELNNKGFLYSIDLPPTFMREDYKQTDNVTLPKQREIGWLVPENLKKRWRLTVGDSKEVLPPLLNVLEVIDMFLHDSEHTYHHMMFEYNEAWRCLKKSGVLVSDDVDWNNAFKEFVSTKQCKHTLFYGRLGVCVK